MASPGKVSPGAWERVTRGIRKVEQLPRRLWRPRRPRVVPAAGAVGTTSATDTDCRCGGCLQEGSITACAAVGSAPEEFRLLLLTGELANAFGNDVVLAHISGCTWESDLFEDVDLGDGLHDYTFRLVFSGTSIEDATLTLEDET